MIVELMISNDEKYRLLLYEKQALTNHPLLNIRIKYLHLTQGKVWPEHHWVDGWD